MHFLGYKKPRKGHYLTEAIKATKLMKRFFDLNIEKVNKYEINEIFITN
jgi:hypothetical protein